MSKKVFADLGIANAEEHAVKAELVAKIMRFRDAGTLTQVDLARRLGIGQPDLSRILDGNFSKVSVDKLLEMITRLGFDITIQVKATRKKTGTVLVAA